MAPAEAELCIHMVKMINQRAGLAVRGSQFALGGGAGRGTVMRGARGISLDRRLELLSILKGNQIGIQKKLARTARFSTVTSA